MREYKIVGISPTGQKETLKTCYGKETAEEEKELIEEVHPEAEIKIKPLHHQANRMF